MAPSGSDWRGIDGEPSRKRRRITFSKNDGRLLVDGKLWPSLEVPVKDLRHHPEYKDFDFSSVVKARTGRDLTTVKASPNTQVIKGGTRRSLPIPRALLQKTDWREAIQMTHWSPQKKKHIIGITRYLLIYFQSQPKEARAEVHKILENHIKFIYEYRTFAFVDDVLDLCARHDRREENRKFAGSLYDWVTAYIEKLDLRVCCLQPRRLAPIIICSCEAVIPTGGKYYVYESPDKKLRGLCCGSCHDNKSREYRIIDLETGEMKKGGLSKLGIRRYLKTLFKLQYNEATEPEPTVECVLCKENFHSVCVGYVGLTDQGEFVCKFCCPSNPANPTSTKMIGHPIYYPETSLSKAVQDAVRSILPPNARDIYVRVISCVPRKFPLNSSVATFVRQFGYPEVISYESRMLFCFQDRKDGNAIAFYGLYFQEYDKKAYSAYRRSINVSMLDSNQMVVLPEGCSRRNLHFEVLLSYLKFMVGKGFRNVYLWSCPPVSKETEYIFYRRPANHKAKDQAELNTWYEELMAEAVKRGTLMKFTTLFKWCQKFKTLEIFFKRFPLFYEDHWLLTLTELVEKHRKRTGTPEQKALQIFKELMGKMKATPHFYRMSLVPTDDSTEFEDLSFLVGSSRFAIRDNFVDFLRKNKAEFADERKAIHSTKLFLTYAMLEGPSNYCDLCYSAIFRGIHCLTCKRDFCVDCIHRIGHHHLNLKKFVAPCAEISEEVRAEFEANLSANVWIKRKTIEKNAYNALLEQDNLVQHTFECKESDCQVCGRCNQYLNLPDLAESFDDLPNSTEGEDLCSGNFNIIKDGDKIKSHIMECEDDICELCNRCFEAVSPSPQLISRRTPGG